MNKSLISKEEYISQEGNNIAPNSLKSIGKFIGDFVKSFVSISVAPYIIPTTIRKIPDYWEKYDVGGGDDAPDMIPAGHYMGGLSAALLGYPAQIVGCIEFIKSNPKESEGLEKLLIVAGTFVATNILSALYETIRHNIKKRR